MRTQPMHTHRTIRTLLTAALFTGFAAGLASCNIVAPIAYAVHGPGKVQAKYELPPEATTVVFIDDPQSKAGRRRDRDVIGQSATQTLLAKGLIVDMIDPQAASLAAVKDRHGEPLSISEIGAAVDADIVIYALLTEFTLSSDGNVYNPSAMMRIKVLDVATGERLWPEDPRGSTVRIRPEYRPGQIPRDRADMAEANADLATKAGLAIAQQFYTHEITENVSR